MQKADENNLKSSMDRFIVKTVQHSRKRLVNLKSSMDRFIVHKATSAFMNIFI